MLSYLIIIIVLLFLLFITKNNNIIENLEPVTVAISGSPEEISLQLNKNSKEVNEKITKTFSEGVYLTNNDINYNLLDETLDSLERQYQLMEYNINNLKINVKVTTEQNSKYEPPITLYGSFPTNIVFNMNLPSPIPGKIGDQGEKGDTGEKGKMGNPGSKGQIGPFGACPKK